MKKLLLSLGALSAVVAPVAAVVACGSTDSDSTLDRAKAAALKNTTLTQEQKDAINGAKTMDALTTVLTEQTNAAGNAVDASEITDTVTALSPTEVATATVTKMLSDAGYSMTDAAKTELVTYLLKVSGDDTLTLGEAFAGKLGDSTHGDDDFAVVINGKTVQNTDVAINGDGFVNDLSGDNQIGVGEQVGVNLSWSEILNTQFHNVKTQDEKWGHKAEDLTNGRFVIFLQGSTLEVAQLAQVGDSIVEFTQPVAHFSDNSAKEKYATKTFAITTDAK